jgi:hypothetical protein
LKYTPNTTASRAASKSASGNTIWEFELDSLELAGCGRGDSRSDRGGAGEGDHVDPAMPGHRGTDDGSWARHDVDHSVWDAGFATQFGEQDSRTRCELAGLDDRRTSHGEGERQLLTDDEQREVPRHDEADDAKWLVEHEPEHIFAEPGVGIAVRVTSEGRRVLPQVSGCRHLIACLTDRLSALEGLHPGEAVEVPPDQFGDLVQGAGTANSCESWPGAAVERGTGGTDGTVHVGVVALRVGADGHLVCWARHVESVAFKCVDGVAADQHLPGGGFECVCHGRTPACGGGRSG